MLEESVVIKRKRKYWKQMLIKGSFLLILILIVKGLCAQFDWSYNFKAVEYLWIASLLLYND